MWQSPILPPERWTSRSSSSKRDAAARHPSRRRLVSLMLTSSSTMRTSTNVSLLFRWMYVLRIGCCCDAGVGATTSPSELSASAPAVGTASTTSPCSSLRWRFFATSIVSSIGIDHRLLLGSTIGSFADQLSALLPINRRLYHL
jgi:hypothetical protein